ncbi:MAG: YajQ family cyclic di-GMP-binding protein [Candidatus Omnitrophica bacterium]|nr:YajQ family cyclic di-GMP-binding protein [Candidatus Omnitrophota bacterium]
MFSFDIVSEVDLQEVDNAVNQAKKELFNRYDFKGSKSSIDYNRDEKKITLITTDDFKLRALKDIILTRAVKRGVSVKALKFGEPEKVFGGNLKQVAEITTGIPRDKAKELVKTIKGLDLKLQSQIEGDKIRVSSPKKDDLQVAIQRLKGLDFSIPLNFDNYR